MLPGALTSAAAVGSSTTLATDGMFVMTIPAFAPAIVVVGIVLCIARKDRQDELEEAASDGGVDVSPSASPRETSSVGRDGAR